MLFFFFFPLQRGWSDEVVKVKKKKTANDFKTVDEIAQCVCVFQSLAPIVHHVMFSDKRQQHILICNTNSV